MLRVQKWRSAAGNTLTHSANGARLLLEARSLVVLKNDGGHDHLVLRRIPHTCTVGVMILHVTNSMGK